MCSRSPEVLVAGAGPMAEEHVRALLAVGVPADAVLVVGRERDRAEELGARCGVEARWGGVEMVKAPPAAAIVAVPETELVSVARHLLERGARAVLLEKPGALTVRELDGLDGRSIFVGYNRRFYPSAVRARELVAADGGVVSVSFDFTEIEERVLADARRRRLGPAVLERWGIANSLHVIDLAFHLAGEPVRIEAQRAGSLPWHPAGAVFAGAGELTGGGLFSYLAAWNGAGRWSIELATRNRRLVLRPLEELQEQRTGSFELEPVELEREPEGVKPGIVGQARAFLATARGDAADPALCTVADARARLELAARIFSYE